jgi:hypothetical protein
MTDDWLLNITNMRRTLYQRMPRAKWVTCKLGPIQGKWPAKYARLVSNRALWTRWRMLTNDVANAVASAPRTKLSNFLIGAQL